MPATLGRLQGYKDALASFGVRYDESLVCAEESVAEGGYRGALKSMQLPDPPTALFCCADRMAMGTYDALRRLNLAIPQDVAVMGFDNQIFIASNLHPPFRRWSDPTTGWGLGCQSTV